MANLTQRLVESVRPPKSGQLLIRDDSITGLALRVTAGGVKAFVFEGRIQGQPRRYTLGQYPAITVRRARTEVNRVKGDIAAGKNPVEERKQQRKRRDDERQQAKGELTLGMLIDEYMTQHSRKHNQQSTADENERIVKRYLDAEWRSRKVSAITFTDVLKLHTSVGEKNGHFAANHLVRLLCSMFNFGIKAKFVQTNPARWIKSGATRPGSGVAIELYDEPPRERFLTDDEVGRVNEALMAETDWRWRAYFPLALMIGQRRSAISAARWEHVDFERRTVTIPRTNAASGVKTKRKKPLVLPLSSKAIKLLASLPSRPGGPEASEWIFPCNAAEGHKSRSGHVEEAGIAWRRICRRAKVAGCTIHGLRHTFGTWRSEEGDSLYLIGKALGHLQPQTTERYLHVNVEPLRPMFEANSQRLFPTLPTSIEANATRMLDAGNGSPQARHLRNFPQRRSETPASQRRGV